MVGWDGIGSSWHVVDVLAISNWISLAHVASNATIGVRNRRVSRSGVWHWLLARCNLVRISDCRSQFLLDRLERCLKLIVSYRGTSSHEFASQFGLEFFYTRKNYKNTVSARSLTVSATTVRTAQQERQFIPSRLLTSQFTQMSKTPR